MGMKARPVGQASPAMAGPAAHHLHQVNLQRCSPLPESPLRRPPNDLEAVPLAAPQNELEVVPLVGRSLTFLIHSHKTLGKSGVTPWEKVEDPPARIL